MILTEIDSVTVYNQSEYPAVINSIDFSDPAAAAAMKFELTNIPTLPYSLSGNDSIKINIRFTPQAEKDYSAAVSVGIEGRSNKFNTNVSGSGWIPNYQFTWNCPDPVKAGGESYGSLAVKSTDTKIGLKIHDIKFVNAASDYTFVDNTKNISLGVGESKTFNVKFNPKKAGMSADGFIISTDAVEGPETDPNIDSTFAVSCEVLGVNVSNGIDFGNLLLCDNAKGTVSITNTSASTDLQITAHKFVNNDQNAFSTDFADGTAVGPGKVLSVNVLFTPPGKGTFTSTLVLTTATGEELSFDLTGSAQDFALYSTKGNFKAKPDDNITIPVLAEIPDFASRQINGFVFDLTCNPKILKITGTNFDAWTVQEISSGTYRVTCTVALPTPHNGELVTLNGKVYLGDTTETKIYLKPYFNSCEGGDSLISILSLTGICDINNTKLVFTNSATKIVSIVPNPAFDKVQITYSTAITAPVKLELFNYLGEKIATLVDENQTAGNHTVSYDTFETGNGTYFLRLTQSGNTLTKSLIIKK